MKDIPADGIYYDDALVIVARMLTPDWQSLEERLNPSSPYYDKFPNQAEKYRAYDKALQLAHEWLEEKRGCGILVALRRDPKTGGVVQLHRDEHIDRYAPERGGQPIYFKRKSFYDAVKEIAHPEAMAFAPVQTGQAGPAERELLVPKAWLAKVRKDHPRQQNEPLVAYAGRLHNLMQEAHVTKVWTFKTLLRRLHDK